MVRRVAATVIAFVVVVSACSGDTAPADDADDATPTTTATTTARPAPTLVDEGPTAEVELPAELGRLDEVWPTNWARRTIDLEELRLGLGGADPRDLIRPIDDPVYEDVASADEWLEDQELGILFEVEGVALFFPLRILTAHEIVNDVRGNTAFSVTYCPLCNTAVAFDRRVDGATLRLGVSGLLRFSDLVMWDDRTVSLWQQTTGEAIVGEMAGTQLDMLPTALVRWADFKAEHLGGDVLSQESGPFDYGANPYVGYSSRPGPFAPFFPGEVDDRYEALSRVVGVRVDGISKAYPFAAVADAGALNDEVAGLPVAVFWGAPDTADPLDAASVAGGRGIGTGIAFDRRVGGQVLTFTANGDDTFTDGETGTTWTLLGTAVDGPLAGDELTPVVHQNEFWFAWAAFNQGSPVYGEEG